MIVGVVDPRDQDWELDRPRYRVYFHLPGGAADEYEVSEADVDEVLAWARTRSRAFALYACVTVDDWLGLLRLAGAAPDATMTSPWQRG